jgi:hypothetical protein
MLGGPLAAGKHFQELLPPSCVIAPTQQRVNGTGKTPAVHPKGHPAKLPDGLFAALPQRVIARPQK